MIGSSRACERFLETFRQRVAATLLVGDRLLKERLAPRRLFGEDPLRVVELGALGRRRLAVPDDALQVARPRPASPSSTGIDFEFRFELGHGSLSFLHRAEVRSFSSQSSTTGCPAASVARTSTRLMCSRAGLNRCPSPVTKLGERRLEAPAGGELRRHAAIVRVEGHRHVRPRRVWSGFRRRARRRAGGWAARSAWRPRPSAQRTGHRDRYRDRERSYAPHPSHPAHRLAPLLHP